MPKISVIVPVYNVEQYVQRAVGSILAQTLEDVEYIFVNDGSTDSSLQKLQETIESTSLQRANKNPLNVKIINKEKNEGLPQARRSGLTVATGKYVIHFDSDDWVEPDCLARMYAVAEEHAADMVIANICEYDGESTSIVMPVSPFTTGIEGIERIFRGRLHGSLTNKLVRRSLYAWVEFPKENMLEDLVVVVQLLNKAQSFAFMKEAFYHYCTTNTGSISRNPMQLRRKMHGAYVNLCMVEKFLKEAGIMKPLTRAFACETNTYKASWMAHRETRDASWLQTLFPESKDYVFSECNLPWYRRLLLWLSFHGINAHYWLTDWYNSKY